MGNLSPEKGSDRHKVTEQSEAEQDENLKPAIDFRTCQLSPRASAVSSTRKDFLGNLPDHPLSSGHLFQTTRMSLAGGHPASQTVGSLKPC